MAIITCNYNPATVSLCYCMSSCKSICVGTLKPVPVRRCCFFFRVMADACERTSMCARSGSLVQSKCCDIFGIPYLHAVYMYALCSFAGTNKPDGNVTPPAVRQSHGEPTKNSFELT